MLERSLPRVGVVEAADLLVRQENLPTLWSVRASRRVAPDLATFLGALDLEVPQAPLDVSGDASLCCWWLEPRAWLLVGDAPRAMPVPLAGALITDVADRYTAFRISGARSEELLASAISVTPAALAPGHCVRTRFAEEAEVLVQRLPGSMDHRLLIDVSLSAYASAWLQSAY